jgi:hypothetical protein
MKKKASAGYGGVQRTPPNIRKGKAVSKDRRSIEAFSPPSSMEESLPYDSERMPPRPTPRFANCDIISPGGRLRWGRTDIETADDSKKGEGGLENSFGVDAIFVPQSPLRRRGRPWEEGTCGGGDVHKIIN